MSPIGSDGLGLLVIIAVAALAHEPWRWLGAALGQNVREGDAVFHWVRLVSSALVAGLVARLVLFPAGELTAVPLWMRAVCFAVGCAAYFATGRSLGLGIAIGCAVLAAVAAVVPSPLSLV